MCAAGMVVSLPNGSAPVRLDRLARYKLLNGLVNASGAHPPPAAAHSLPAPGVPNKQSHQLGVFSISGESLLPAGAKPAVDMATCHTDALGFCWSAKLSRPLELAPGGSYVVAAQEGGGDGYAEMTDPATATIMGHRIGTTYMSYVTPGGPRAPAVTGRAWRAGNSGAFSVIEEIDSSFVRPSSLPSLLDRS